MARPVVDATTELLYAMLPEVYRTEDEDLGAGPNGYPLLRFLSLAGDQLGELRTVVGRIDYYALEDGGVAGDTSDLADPATADPAWLDWLGQLVGVALAPELTVVGRRDSVAGAAGGFRAGTRPAIAAAAQSALTGTRYVNVLPHYTGDPWKVEVRVRASEVATTTAAIVAAIIAKGAKPAGVELVVTTVEASWDTLAALRPTWADWDAAGSWVVLEETGA